MCITFECNNILIKIKRIQIKEPLTLQYTDLITHCCDNDSYDNDLEKNLKCELWITSVSIYQEIQPEEPQPTKYTSLIWRRTVKSTNFCCHIPRESNWKNPFKPSISLLMIHSLNNDTKTTPEEHFQPIQILLLLFPISSLPKFHNPSPPIQTSPKSKLYNLLIQRVLPETWNIYG